MPYDSNGNYTLPNSYFVANGDTVLPIQHNPPLEDIQAALSSVLLRSGVAPMTGDLKMGTKKITGMADGTATTDGATKGQVDLASLKYAVKNANYKAVSSDNATAFRFTGAFTLSFDPAATLGASWNATVIADGGDVTLDPDSSETVDGFTSLVVPNGRSMRIICDGAGFRTDFGQNIPLHELIQDLTLSNNVANSNTHVDIAAGTVFKGPRLVRNLATLTKRLNATFVAGNGNGGLDIGAVAANTSYFAYALRKDADGSFDAVFSTSATIGGVNTTSLTGYTIVKPIGVVLTDGSSNIRPFTMNPGDEYTWTTPIPDVVNFLMGATSGLMALTVPNGVKVKVKITASFTSPTITNQALISSPDQGILVAGIGNNGGNVGTIQVANGFVTADLKKWTNTARHLRYVAGANGNLWVWTNGFTFPCGRR